MAAGVHAAATGSGEGSGMEQGRSGSKKSVQERVTTPKSNGSVWDRAGRTFSFGSRKNSGSPRKEETIPEVPSLPTIQQEDPEGRSRGMTTSTVSTATPPKLESGGGLDLGGDFGSMFAFDKRASSQTLKQGGPSNSRSLTGNRNGQPPLSVDTMGSPIESAPKSWNSQSSGDNLLSAAASPTERLPSNSRRAPQGYGSLNRNPSDSAEDEDTVLIKDSIAASQFLSNNLGIDIPASRSKRDDFLGGGFNNSRSIAASYTKDDDNLFESSMARMRRQPNRFATQPRPTKQKVMTPAEFERYRKDKEYDEAAAQVRGEKKPVEDEDDINYDEEEDEAEKSKQQTKQRRKQEAHMAVYRQQMMKVTGEPAKPSPTISMTSRPALGTSLSAPHLSLSKTPSPVPTSSDDDDDDEVPLAILQAHGFPAKNRPPTRLTSFGSNPNLRSVSTQPQPQRPGSAMGGAGGGGENSGAQRQSSLPAFARNLPQDPFIGAGIAKPAIRESISYGGGAPAGRSTPSLHPGGLVGVIASEERSKAMRRGSPNFEAQNSNNGMGNQGFNPMTGIPHQMMYGGQDGGMNNMPGMMPPNMMPQMPQQMLSPGDQAQMQMNQQMQQFMQMQMQFMQMMATGQNANGGQPQMNQGLQPQQQMYGNGGLAYTQSMGDLSNMMNSQQHMEPPRQLDPSMRTMSMVQPSSASFVPGHGYARSINGMGQGYAPSIAPSERSNVGLPGRYRPVSQAFNPPPGHSRSPSAAGSLTQWDNGKLPVPTKVVRKSTSGSDDDSDDEEGWAAMQAKRDQKMATWKTKKEFGDLTSLM